jgi:hypothetical protein
MIKNCSIIITLTLILLGCKAKEKVVESIACKNSYTIQYDNKRDNYYPLAPKNMKSTTVYFIDEYDDDIKGFINEEQVFNQHVKMSGNEDGLSYNFICKISDKEALPTIKIESTTQNTCFDFKVDKKYKLVYVYLSRNGKWTIRFSNRYMIYA